MGAVPRVTQSMMAPARMSRPSSASFGPSENPRQAHSRASAISLTRSGSYAPEENWDGLQFSPAMPAMLWLIG